MTQVADKPSIDDAMQHFGVMGMHWGVRQSKAKAGFSRSNGALVDRNARLTKTLTDERSGSKHKYRVALGKKVIGEKRWESNFQTTIKDMKTQDARLKLGKASARDNLDKFANLNLASLVISRTPKH